MKAKANQSILDIATQLNGDAKAVIDILILNNLSVTKELTPGEEVKEAESLFKNELVTDYFQAKEIELATGGIKAEAEALGIGTYIIDTNFYIS